MLQVEQQLKNIVVSIMAADPAHDINHIERVVASAKAFAIQEGASLDIVIPAAWLHDCVSLPKNHPDRHLGSQFAAKQAITYLKSINYPERFYADIEHAIEAHSYSANIDIKTIEAAVVQDADRIDALGAIGIARCIQVGTTFGANLYSNDDPFCEHRQYDDKHFSVDHFYNKLFKLKDTMNTKTAEKEAQIRTEYMKDFLVQLQNEIGV